MDHIHGSYESTNRFRINPFSRAIINESEISIVIAQYDHNSERFIFELPKIVEEHDMTLCDSIRIHYINAGSNNKANKDVYIIEDLKISDDDSDTVTFSWLLSKSATSINGVLSFAIEFVCTTDGKVDYSWSTLPSESIKISETYNISDNVIEEDYSDILEQWKEELFSQFMEEGLDLSDYYNKDETNTLLATKADNIAGMQKISLVDTSTLDRELDNDEYIKEDSFNLTHGGTLTIGFKGYIHFRMVVNYNGNTLFVDGVEVDANPYLGDDFVLEYNGFVNDNIQIKCNAGCEHTIDFYGISDLMPGTKINEEIANVNASIKGYELAGMDDLSVMAYFNISANRELTSGERVDGRTGAILKAPATVILKPKLKGYYSFEITCVNHPANACYDHYVYVDGKQVDNLDYRLNTHVMTFKGFVVNSVEIKSVQVGATNVDEYKITFNIYGITDLISESEIDKKINANALIASASGEVVRVDDVSASTHRVIAKVGRKRNILPMPYYETSKTVNGVTITTNNDGSITINGTCTGALGFTIFNGSIPLKGNYTLSGVTNTNTGESTHYLQPYIDDVFQTTVVNGSRTYEIDGKLTQLALYVKAGYTFNNVIVYPQLEEGDTATEYEPYVDPSTVTVTSCGKNLFPALNNAIKDGISFTKVEDYYVLNGTATSSGLITTTTSLPSGNYAVSANNPVHNGLDLAIVQIYSDTTKKSLVAKDNKSYSTDTLFLPASNDYQFRIRYENGVTYNNYIVKPQLELGLVVTEYVSCSGRVTRTPASDGTVEIDSISPTMTVFTDTSGVNIDLEYQQDHNKAMGNVRADIKMLDDDLAEIKNSLGDLETLLGGI